MTKRNYKNQNSNQIKRNKKNILRKVTRKKINRKTNRNNSKRKGNKIYLPSELLSLAISKIDRKFSLSNLQEAIKIYDINEEINFEYLSKCGKIDKNNFKYIYTLSFEKRKTLMGKYNSIDGKIFGQESKISSL